jgi:hypothetical protein
MSGYRTYPADGRVIAAGVLSQVRRAGSFRELSIFVILLNMAWWWGLICGSIGQASYLHSCPTSQHLRAIRCTHESICTILKVSELITWYDSWQDIITIVFALSHIRSQFVTETIGRQVLGHKCEYHWLHPSLVLLHLLGLTWPPFHLLQPSPSPSNGFVNSKIRDRLFLLNMR